MIFIATTFYGLENILYDELVERKFKVKKILTRAILFEGDFPELYRANYILSTALRILYLIKSEKISSQTHFYDIIYSIPWHKFFTVRKKFKVDVNLSSNLFNNTLFVAQKTKDAIVDRFRKELHKRPEVDTKRPDIVINIHLSDNQLDVSLDSSGETLNKRGYRLFNVEASLNEVLARGLIRISKWDKNKPLLDIMCGSGTIPIEAHLEANNIPAAYLRNNYSFMHWTNFDRWEWEKIKEKENEKIINKNVKIIGLDINEKAIAKAKQNYINLPYNNNIYFKINDFISEVYDFKNGIIISNLPYDKRIKIESVKDFYNKIGTQLKFHYQSNDIWLFVKKDISKYISLKPTKKYTLLNGNIECSFNNYILF